MKSCDSSPAKIKSRSPVKVEIKMEFAGGFLTGLVSATFSRVAPRMVTSTRWGFVSLEPETSGADSERHTVEATADRGCTVSPGTQPGPAATRGLPRSGQRFVVWLSGAAVACAPGSGGHTGWRCRRKGFLAEPPLLSGLPARLARPPPLAGRTRPRARETEGNGGVSVSLIVAIISVCAQVAVLCAAVSPAVSFPSVKLERGLQARNPTWRKRGHSEGYNGQLKRHLNFILSLKRLNIRNCGEVCIKTFTSGENEALCAVHCLGPVHSSPASSVSAAVFGPYCLWRPRPWRKANVLLS